MPKTIDYFISVVSPYTYLGSRELERIARDHGAEIRVKPISLPKIFPHTGGTPLPQRPQARKDYRFVELKRWRAERDMPLNLEPAHFPVSDKFAAPAVLAAAELGGDPLRLAHAILRAIWAEERNIAEESTVHAIAAETGHDADTLMANAKTPEIAEIYEQTTQEALERGVFGAPWYVVDGEPFWGQDRLNFVERALAGNKA